jgi:sec-independent protein translocase protein TatA
MRLGVWEIVLILVLALVLFGGNKLAGVGKALGQSIRDFKREVQPEKSEDSGEVKKEEKNEESDKA